MRKFVLTVVVICAMSQLAPAGQELGRAASNEPVKFAVIGDTGTGDQTQYEVGRQMAVARQRFPFELVLMLGDNLYGSQQPQDFVDKFERPYATLLNAGVLFFASLGNHDKPANRYYKPFNMGGERYYSYARQQVRFVVLDTNAMDDAQVRWADAVLSASREPWKICYFHHPLYSDAGRHGSNVQLRVLLEPLLVRSGVTVVFSGHDHAYERVKPQKGITYFVEGAGGQLRRGDLDRAAPTLAAGFDEDQTFMLVEVAGDRLTFQTISRTGKVVDSGTIPRRPAT